MADIEILPEEPQTAAERLWHVWAMRAISFALGAALGVLFAPSTPSGVSVDQIASLKLELQAANQKIETYEKERIDTTAKLAHAEAAAHAGKLTQAQRDRHAEALARYAAAFQDQKAQGAAELLQWFVPRWESLLDSPIQGDRNTRRAELLVRLIGGMGESLAAADYVAWQAEFWSGQWLAEAQIDDDGDGFPGVRTTANPKEGFTQARVCEVAMALNQTTRDAQILLMPEMKCNREEQRISVFFSGATMDDAINEYIKALTEEGYAVVDQIKDDRRLVLVGPKKK